MDTSIIAVRVANGTFVPILETSGATRRRLVLTTIRDDQTSVQIDLYRGVDENMENADYIGSLMIENIEPSPAGEADIALLLGVDESGNLNATATDKKSGEYQSLSVGLESVDQDGAYDIPDFELSDNELTLDDLSVDDDEIGLEESASSLELDDVELEEDLTFDIESEPSTDTLAAPGGAEDSEPGELDESVSGEELAGLEAFSEESISLDESLSEESLGEITESDDQFETVSAEETEAEFSTLPDLDEGMIEAELGDEDFTFDEAPELDDGSGAELTMEDHDSAGEAALDDMSLEEMSLGDESLDEESLEDSGFGDQLESEPGIEDEIEAGDFDTEPDENIFDDAPEPAVAEAGESFEASLGGADDFSFEEPGDDGAFGQFEPGESAGPDSGGYSPETQPLTPRRSNPIVFIGYLILSIAALGVLTYLVFRLLEGPAAPPLQALFPAALAFPPWLRRSTRKLGRARKDRTVS